MAPKASRLLFLAAFLVVLTAGLPLFAAGKRRAVAHPSTTTVEFEITGKVVSDPTGLPAVSVRVTSESAIAYTDASGNYRIVLSQRVPAQLTFDRSGFAPKTVTIQEAGKQTLDVRLTPRPTVTVRLTNGTTHQVDFESVTFGYPVAFSGYVDGPEDDFCRADGSQVTIHRDQMKRIGGPATLVTQSGCCSSQQVLRIQMELKSGESSDLTFSDSCFTHSIDLIARDHVSGQFRYIRFADIAEVIFP